MGERDSPMFLDSSFFSSLLNYHPFSLFSSEFIVFLSLKPSSCSKSFHSFNFLSVFQIQKCLLHHLILHQLHPSFSRHGLQGVQTTICIPTGSFFILFLLCIYSKMETRLFSDNHLFVFCLCVSSYFEY